MFGMEKQKLTEGQRIGRTYLNRGKWVLGLEIALLIYMFPMYIFLGSAAPWLFGGPVRLGVLLFFVLLIAAAQWLKERHGRRIRRIMTEECDPYLYKEVLEYLRKCAKKKEHKDAYTVSIAGALMAEGYGYHAFGVLNQIDFEPLPLDCLCKYYEVLTAYFCQSGDENLMGRLRAEIENCLNSQKLSYEGRRLCEFSLAGLKLHEARTARDQAAFDEALEAAQAVVCCKMERISLTYAEALMDAAMKRTDRAMQKLGEVRAGGGRFDIAGKAARCQEELRAGRGASVSEEKPKESIVWEESSIYKPKVDKAYFKKNRRFDIGSRMVYAWAVPAALGIGFLLGYTNGWRLLAQIYQQTAQAVWPAAQAQTIPLIYGILGAVSFAGTVTGVKIVWECLRRRGKLMFTLFCVVAYMYFGVFTMIGTVVWIPYYIYNLVRIVQARRRR